MRVLSLLIFTYILIVMTSFATMAQDNTSGNDTSLRKATLAGGCFWCIETDFDKLNGVTDVVSGYAGGDRPDPTYENYNKPSGSYTVPHIEVIEVTYDPAIVSYAEIIDYHLRHIDPTDGGGQFCDRGPGYRPAIFVKNEEERKIAGERLTEAARVLDQDVDVDILDDAPFYMAEDYHQDYATKNPVRYKFYRWNCGRDQRVQELWNGK